MSKNIQIRLGSDLSFSLEGLPSDVIRELKEQFTFVNPQYQKMKAMGFWNPSEPRRYECITEINGLVKVWRGGAKRVKALLEKHGYTVTWVDKRLKLKETGLTLGSLVLQDNQEPAAKSVIDFQQGLLRGGTGSGKTETLLAAAIMSQQPTLVLVWNKDLLKQWVERILKYGILKESQIGIIQGPKKKVGPITIGMIQTISKNTQPFLDKFGCVIMDECQRTPATTFVKSVLPFPAFYKWGASADEKRKDRKEFLAFEAFGYQEWDDTKKSLKYQPIHEIEGRGQALDPTIIVVPTRYIDHEYEENRNYGQLINRLVEDAERNKLIAKQLRKSLEHGKQVILFTERVEAAMFWARTVSEWGYEAGPLIGGTENAEETSATLERLRSRHCRFAATTSYADVGLDVPSLDTAFVTCPTGNNIKRLNQQVGRVVRPCEGKKDPTVFYFWDRGVSGVSKGTKGLKRRWEKVITLE